MSLDSYVNVDKLRQFYHRIISYSEYLAIANNSDVLMGTTRAICGNHHCRNKRHKGFREGLHNNILGLLPEESVTSKMVWNTVRMATTTKAAPGWGVEALGGGGRFSLTQGLRFFHNLLWLAITLCRTYSASSTKWRSSDSWPC